MNRSISIKAALALSLILSLLLVEYYWDIVSSFHPERIQGILGAAGALAPSLYMVIMATAFVVKPIPSIPLDLAAGIFFGRLMGTVGRGI